MAEWTVRELGILRKWYPSEGSKVAKRLPAHSPESCAKMARKEGLRSAGGWTREEEDELRRLYPRLGAKVAERLPGRSERAVQGKAHELGLSRDRSERVWTDEELEALKEGWTPEGPGDGSWPEDVTRAAAARKAAEIGLRKGSRAGWTEEDKERLIRLYPERGADCADAFPGRTRKAVTRMAKNLGVKGPAPWTEDEIETLRELWPTYGKRCATAFPGRTETAVARAAVRYVGRERSA